jgi:PhnB protein
VKAIPDGYHSVTPYLVVKNAARAISFYERAFGAKELLRMPEPDGRIGHAELRIGDSRGMLAAEFPEMGALGPQSIGGTPVTIHLYVEDVDAVVAHCEFGRRTPYHRRRFSRRYRACGALRCEAQRK